MSEEVDHAVSEIFEEDLALDSEVKPKISLMLVCNSTDLSSAIQSCFEEKGIQLDLSLIASDAFKLEAVENLDNAHVALMEFRVVKFSADLQAFRMLKSKRPLLPVIALTSNGDPEFVTMLYDSGLTDVMILPVDPSVIVAKVNSYKAYGDSGRILEIKNQETISTMQSLRKANDDLKSEMNNRIQAESAAKLAEEQAKRHEQIREIMDSLHEGFFAVDRKGMIGTTISKSCHHLFSEGIAGSRIGSGSLSLKGNTEEQIFCALDQVFENFMPQAVSLSLLPEKVETRSGKILKLAYTPVPSDPNVAPEKIIFLASDITVVERERAEFERVQAETKSLLQILQHKESFLGYLGDFIEQLTKLGTPMKLVEAKRAIHTLKGNSAAFGLVELVRILNDLETQIGEMSLHPNKNVHLSSSRIQAIEKPLRSFLSSQQKVLGIDFEKPVETYTLTLNQLETLRLVAMRVPESAEKQLLLESIAETTYKPISRFASRFEGTVAKLCERLGKQIKFEISGLQHRVDGLRFEGFFQNLIHAVRNAVDHGIESSAQRTAQGKPVEGLIHLKFEIVDQIYLQVVLKDDGGGIDPHRIRAVASAKGIFSEAQLAAMNRDELMQLIFHDGFSTANEVTDISGRGVGMSALKSEVQSLDGTIDIKSQVGKGTEFTILVPLRDRKHLLRIAS